MTALKAVAFACVLACGGGWSGAASAQTPSPSAPALVLLPYEEPGSTDPHAVIVTHALEDAFALVGMPVKSVAPVDHLQALSNPGKLCEQNGATGILVAQGRYEQTRDLVVVPPRSTARGRRPDMSQRGESVTTYPTQVALRLDEIACDGVVRWTTTTAFHTETSDVNLLHHAGAAVDDAFLRAAYDAAAARKAATVAPAPRFSRAPARGAPAPPAARPPYALLPFEQPGLAEARSPEITTAFAVRLEQKGLVVKRTSPVDHFEVFARGPQICALTGARAIIVPALRLEQSWFTGRSHASLRLSVLGCDGTVVRQASAEADLPRPPDGDLGAASVAVSERAMDEAVPKLLP